MTMQEVHESLGKRRGRWPRAGQMDPPLWTPSRSLKRYWLLSPAAVATHLFLSPILLLSEARTDLASFLQ